MKTKESLWMLNFRQNFLSKGKKIEPVFLVLRVGVTS